MLDEKTGFVQREGTVQTQHKAHGPGWNLYPSLVTDIGENQDKQLGLKTTVSIHAGDFFAFIKDLTLSTNFLRPFLFWGHLYSFSRSEKAKWTMLSILFFILGSRSSSSSDKSAFNKFLRTKCSNTSTTRLLSEKSQNHKRIRIYLFFHQHEISKMFV